MEELELPTAVLDLGREDGKERAGRARVARVKARESMVGRRERRWLLNERKEGGETSF